LSAEVHAASTITTLKASGAPNLRISLVMFDSGICGASVAVGCGETPSPQQLSERERFL
jgi:hypothetical protein